jgi:hypothetical protein
MKSGFSSALVTTEIIFHFARIETIILEPVAKLRHFRRLQTAHQLYILSVCKEADFGQRVRRVIYYVLSRPRLISTLGVSSRHTFCEELLACSDTVLVV